MGGRGVSTFSGSITSGGSDEFSEVQTRSRRSFAQPKPRTPLQEEALDKIRADFLQDLDDSVTVEVDDFEADFLKSNLRRKSFSPGQRRVIDKMRRKFERRLS